MGWMERNEHYFSRGGLDGLYRYFRAAGLEDALRLICGDFGVRRFIIRFSFAQNRVRVQALDSVALQKGGGPPPPELQKSGMPRLEQALTRLYFNMQTGPKWQEGAIGYVRDCDNRFSILPFFDEDLSFANLSVLPIPEEGHPLEGPEYKKIIGSMEAQLTPVIARTHSVRSEWSHWEITARQLSLFYGAESNESISHHKVQTLATYSLSQKLWKWQVEEPLFSEEVFCWERIVVSFDAAMELGMVSTARLGASWLFVAAVDQEGVPSGDLSLLAAVWDGYS